jgi:hypothetical protein
MRDDRNSMASGPTDDTVSKNTTGGTDISRRNFLSRACAQVAVQAAVVGTVSLTITGDAKAEYWVWKSNARYQYYPNGPARCAGCVNFRPYAACAVVEPPISPDGWCRYFNPIPVVYAPPDYPPPAYAPVYPQPYYPQPYYPQPYYPRPWRWY